MAMVEVVLQNEWITVLKVDRRAVRVLRSALSEAEMTYQSAALEAGSLGTSLNQLAHICERLFVELGDAMPTKEDRTNDLYMDGGMV